MKQFQQMIEQGQSIFHQVPLPMAITSIEGTIVWWSREAEKIFGYSSDEAVNQSLAIIAPNTQVLFHTFWNKAIYSLDPMRIDEVSLQTKNESALEASCIVKSFSIENQRWVMCLFDLNDEGSVTAYSDIQELTSYKTGLDLTFMMSFYDRDGLVTYANSNFLKTSHWTPKRVIGKSFWQLFPENSMAVADEIWDSLKAKKIWQGVVEKLAKTGETYWVDLTAIPIDTSLDETNYFLVIEKDVSKDIALQKHLEEIAFVDYETGLMNRHYLERVVNEFIDEKRHFSFVYLIIDNYFTLKDLLAESDESLSDAFSKRMNMYFQDSEIARFSENEFAIVTPLSDWYIQGFSSYLKQHPIYVQNKSFVFSITGSIVRYPEEQDSYYHLTRASDAIIRRNRQAGASGILGLSKSDHTTLNRRAAIEKRLLEALHDDDLNILYQPIFKCGSTDHLLAVEALVRWEDEQLGVVAPDELIPIAEETGLIQEIGTFVLKHACLQAKQWHEEGKAFKISVNASIREFRDQNMARKVQSMLQETGCPASVLQFEITETFALEAEADRSIVQQMMTLQKLGITFVLDDFGTGYASFRYLQLLPISEVKIDRTFISSLLQREKNAQLVSGMIQLAKSLHLRVIAEGVETEEQLRALEEMGCDAYQGYYAQAPVSASKI